MRQAIYFTVGVLLNSFAFALQPPPNTTPPPLSQIKQNIINGIDQGRFKIALSKDCVIAAQTNADLNACFQQARNTTK